MKKSIYSLLAVALLSVGLVACSSSSSYDPEITSDGALGKYGPKLFDQMTEFFVDFMQEMEAAVNEFYGTRNADEKEFAKKSKKFEKEGMKYAEDLKEMIEKASKALQGKEVKTELEDDGHMKIVQPFKITELSLPENDRRSRLDVVCECIVELTKNCPASNDLFQISCEDKANENVEDTWMYNIKRIEEGDGPDGIYAAGTQFAVRVTFREHEIDKNDEHRMSKGIFMLDHFKLRWVGSMYTLGYGKLGPITIGRPVGSAPDEMEGLYDNYKHEKIVHEDDMDGPWTEESYLFTLKGEEIFRAYINDGVVSSIRALPGSSKYIKTTNGVSVGKSARNLFNEIWGRWDTYYDGEVFMKNSGYTYYVSDDDVIKDGDREVPTSSDHFKQDAKVIGIVY
ncbi:MAG: hypothetical protein J1E37_04675 [Prevotella sp.]|nr:hypothetical protein [Prevotella sp.]